MLNFSECKFPTIAIFPFIICLLFMWKQKETISKMAARKLMNYLSGKEIRDWLTSTHFWGPFATWSIPIAAIADTQKEADLISGKMTLALLMYSSIFMRFAWKVNPRNLLLLSCHFTNTCAQLIQGTRYLKNNYRKPNV